MTTNVGSTDAIVRWIFAAVFFAAAVVFNAIPVVTLMAAVLGLVMAGTALTRSCPLYTILGLNTRERDEQREQHVR